MNGLVIHDVSFYGTEVNMNYQTRNIIIIKINANVYHVNFRL